MIFDKIVFYIPADKSVTFICVDSGVFQVKANAVICLIFLVCFNVFLNNVDLADNGPNATDF